jgi:hypothetical protein
MSLFSLSSPDENRITRIFFECYSVSKSFYRREINYCYKRCIYIISDYAYHNIPKDALVSMKDRETGNNKEIMLPYINFYIQYPDGNYFDTQHIITLNHFMYYINFWGHKEIMNALIKDTRIMFDNPDFYLMPIFNSDKILFSIL